MSYPYPLDSCHIGPTVAGTTMPPLPPPPRRTSAPSSSVDLLVCHAVDLLQQAHREALRECIGHNVDLLIQALDACEQWLGR